MQSLMKIIIIVFIFIAGFFFGTQYAGIPANNADQATLEAIRIQEPQELKVSIEFDPGDNRIKSFEDVIIQKDQTVFDVMKKITADNVINLQYKDYGGEMGVFVEVIGDKANDTKSNLYWQLYVNGAIAPVGPGGYKLAGGEKIEWKYAPSQF